MSDDPVERLVPPMDFSHEAKMLIRELAGATKSYDMPTTAYVRPCERIEPEAYQDGLGFNTIAARYAKLTDELPLRGASAMHRLPASSELSMVAELRARAPWFEPAIAIVERQLELQLLRGNPWLAFRPMLLLGPPGVGKSWFARTVAELSGAGIGTADLAGSYGDGLIAGNPRGYIQNQPCFPAVVMNQTATANPVCIVEEVDKAGGSERTGDPLAALLNLIEPGSATAYYDKCLLAPVDVSHVNWILTANTLGRLTPPLLSRLDVVEIAPPTKDMFEGVIEQLTRSLCAGWGVSPSSLVLPAKAINTLRRDFGRRRSVRRLSMILQAIAPHCLVAATRH